MHACQALGRPATTLTRLFPLATSEPASLSPRRAGLLRGSPGGIAWRATQPADRQAVGLACFRAKASGDMEGKPMQLVPLIGGAGLRLESRKVPLAVSDAPHDPLELFLKSELERRQQRETRRDSSGRHMAALIESCHPCTPTFLCHPTAASVVRGPGRTRPGPAGGRLVLVPRYRGASGLESPWFAWPWCRSAGPSGS